MTAPLTLEQTHAAYARHRAIHESRDWDNFAALFAQNARYFDPFYGWMEGRDAIDRFIHTSMAGLDAWTFPIHWQTTDEGRVVIHWTNRLPGRRPDGSSFEFPGVSAITYGADGLVVEQRDFYDGFTALRTIMAARTGGLGRLTGRAWDVLSGGALGLAHRFVARTES